MGRQGMIAAVLVLGSILGCPAASALPADYSTEQNAKNLRAFADNEQNEKSLLKILLPVLKTSGKAARIYYPGVCQSLSAGQGNYLVAFPTFVVQKPIGNSSGLAAIREIFKNDHSAIVTEDRPGLIRIRLGDVPDRLLSTKISTLRLQPFDQYNYQLAIDAIIGNRQVQDAMRNLGVRTPLKVYSMLVTSPAKGLVHLPASMSGLTMDQALDEVALTFKAVVFYGACTQPRMFDITPSGGINFDDTWLDR